MNNLLKLKLDFQNEPNKASGGPANFTKNRSITFERVERLIKDLLKVKKYYTSQDQIINGFLIDVNFDNVIAKTNRLQKIFSYGADPNSLIVGARFSDDAPGQEKHILTYYVDENNLNSTIDVLKEVSKFLQNEFPNGANHENFDDKKNSIMYNSKIAKTNLRALAIDCSFILSFDIPRAFTKNIEDNSIITFFNTEKQIGEIFDKIGFQNFEYSYCSYGKNTISTTKDLTKKIIDKIPYLISMVSSDINSIKSRKVEGEKTIRTIQNPANEPFVGVIDTLFDENVYFNKWVVYEEKISPYEKLSSKKEDYYHGTEVSSIIVDGPSLNPALDDKCGRFRVKHFGVCTDKVSITSLVSRITEIVNDHPEIHVWNLSLGTTEQVNRFFESYDGYALDCIQAEKDIIFVVSGTNDDRLGKNSPLRVGSPADSVNSLVVNSVNSFNKPASYSRKGPILSFFGKPDISYYGGDYDDNERLVVWSPAGEAKECGTSFAAPWISRKLAYLIEVLGLPRNVAKALIIDSAAGWSFKQINYKDKDWIGYGVVPIDINDVLQSDDSEIKFYLSGESIAYKTVNYQIPVPKDSDDNSPYIARATLCYSPNCNRLQGVDYTERELSLNFGTIRNNKICSIDENKQDDEDSAIDERSARNKYRKWDNTKFISSILKNNRPKKTDRNLWGFAVVSKERNGTKIYEPLKFGAVITLKEINGVNRIEDFKTICALRGYICTEVLVKNQVVVYNKGKDDVDVE